MRPLQHGQDAVQIRRWVGSCAISKEGFTEALSLEPYKYLSSPASASRNTRASSRTRGETSPSLTAVATVTGLVRSSQTVAIASTTLTIAMNPNRLTPRRWNRIRPQGQSYRSARTPRAAAALHPPAQLRPRVDRPLPLAQAAEAQPGPEASEHSGKLAMEVSAASSAPADGWS